LTAGGAAEAFWAELRALYEDAGEPKLSTLVKLGRDQKPSITISDSTINAWLLAKSVPITKKSKDYFMIMAKYLHGRARLRRQGPFPESRWRRLLDEAGTQRRANVGGRPSARNLSPAARQQGERGPVTLPGAPAGFVGRGAQIGEVLAALDPSGDRVIAVVAGMPGVGKTALAVQAAREAGNRGWFAGGILFEDLRGFSTDTPLTADAAAGRLLRALDPAAAQSAVTSEEQLSAWRQLQARYRRDGRTVLLVLDNAATAAQLAGLIPDAPHRVLVTSRHNLSSLGAIRVELPVLSEQESLQLLDTALRIARAADARVSEQSADARRLAELCGYLPLALRITAALLSDVPGRSLAAQVQDLTNARTRLQRLDYDDLAVRAAFDLSYQRLSVAQARAFRLLPVIPGPSFSEEAAAVVLGQSAGDTHRLVADLHRLHLLESVTESRWGWHDLIRLYANEPSLTRDVDDDRDGALSRLIDHYRKSSADADAWLRTDEARQPRRTRFGSREQAVEWFDGEYTNLVAVVAVANEAGRWRDVCDLADHLEWYCESHHRIDGWLSVGRLALAAAGQLGSARVRRAANLLGNACRVARRFDESVTYFQQALDLARADGDRVAEGAVLHNLGLTYFRLGRYAEAETCHRRDWAICEAAGNPRGGPGHGRAGRRGTDAAAVHRSHRGPQPGHRHSRPLWRHHRRDERTDQPRPHLADLVHEGQGTGRLHHLAAVSGSQERQRSRRAARTSQDLPESQRGVLEPLPGLSRRGGPRMVPSSGRSGRDTR
jgi:tetratricopeptide (TPR) repeat protein